MTIYDEALEAIKNKQSVVIKGVLYNLNNIQDLPKLEEMVEGDNFAEQEAFDALRKEKEELEKRLKAFDAKPKTEKPKTEVEDKK